MVLGLNFDKVGGARYIGNSIGKEIQSVKKTSIKDECPSCRHDSTKDATQ